MELLNEVAQPGIRDLKVEFKGVKVAAMYPDRLPNLAAGTQQILVGRYLPEGKDQQGEVVVTGTRGTEPVRFAAKINFKDAEEGNSFIPRLWARSHLDHLLQQGSSQAIQDDIIALSEEFHIITPYTSLLVLESDADRERFGVKRRYEMRDGERFFAEGKANANFELAQQQMKRAADWRLGLRRDVLRQLGTLGRNPNTFQQPIWKIGTGGLTLSGINTYTGGTTISSGTLVLTNGTLGLDFNGGTVSLSSSLSAFDLGNNDSTLGYSGAFGFPTTAMPGGEGRSSEWASLPSDRKDFIASPDEPGSPPGKFEPESRMKGEKYEEDERFLTGTDEKLDLGKRKGGAGTWRTGQSWGEDNDYDEASFNGPMNIKEESRSIRYLSTDRAINFGDAINSTDAASFLFDSSDSMGGDVGNYENAAIGGKRLSSGLYRRTPPGYYPNYTSWLSSLVPQLAGRPGKPHVSPTDPETWSAEALALSKSLSRLESLHKLAGGIELNTTSETFDPNWNRTSSRSSNRALYAPTGWLTKPLNPNEQTIINYCDKKERGVFSLAFLLGQTRPASERDLTTVPFSLSDWSLLPLHETYRAYTAKVEKAGENQVNLILTLKNSTYVQHYLIDTAKHVLLSWESFNDVKSGGIAKFSDFVEVGGSWWATKMTTQDAKERKVAEATFVVKGLAKDQYAERMKAELSILPQVQLLHQPFVKLKDARQHVADGSANFDDRLAMILYNCQLQQWDEVLKQLDAAEKLAMNKPGVRWLRTRILATMARNEEARQRLAEEAKTLIAKPVQDELFLTSFVSTHAQGVNSPAEYLDFLKTLKAVYDRQPANPATIRPWLEQLANAHESLTGHIDEVLALRKRMAEEAPWEVSLQISYAQRLRTAGQPETAYAWLDMQLARPETRTDAEDESLRNAFADLYRGEARWADLLKFTTSWIAKKPESASPYQQHLAALVYNEKLDDAYALAEQWLKEGRIEGKLAPDLRARLTAALAMAQGTAYNISFYRDQERWNEPLAETARFFVRKADELGIAQQIVNSRFNQSEMCDRLRAHFLGLLQTDLDKLSPEQISFLVSQTMSGRLEFAEPVNGHKQIEAQEVPVETWQKLAAQVRARWEKATDKDGKNDKHSLGETLVTIYTNRFNETELLPFLRERIKAATPEFKPGYITNLFNTLLGRKWTKEIEDEAFHTLRELTYYSQLPTDPTARLLIQIPALYRLDDAMLANRQAKANEELNDAGKVNELTRTELFKKRAEVRHNALASLAERLAAEFKSAEKDKSPLADWFRIEQSWLDVQLDQHRDETLAFCWNKLGELPPRRADKADPDEEIPVAKIQQNLLESVLRQRAFVTAMNLAARKNADPKATDRLLKYIDAGIAQGAEAATAWRRTKYQLLIALDRPDNLERELRVWIRTDITTAPWRKSLALLVAERGKLDEAIQLFEALVKDKLLGFADYRTLSGWYQVQNRREDYERAKLEVYQQMPEGYLNQLINNSRNRWVYHNNRPLPSELDEGTLLAYRALFAKSAVPGNYLSQLRDLYAACRDFRLLQMVPDSMMGHSPQQIYNILSQVKTSLLYEMRNEATADEILAHIKKLRAGDRTAIDLRALDLFEAMVERQSSEIQNQRGPHVEACLAALRRAFERKWSDGEPRLMSGFLRVLGHLPDPKLQDEQFRELRELLKIVPANSRDHLYMTFDLCELTYWQYSLKPEGLQIFEAEINAYDQANHGQWPYEDDQILGDYVRMLEDSRRYVDGDNILQKYLANPQHISQRYWLQDRLWQLYNDALDHDGEVSLGKREILFQALLASGLAKIEAATNENSRQDYTNRLVNTLSIAYRHNLMGVKEVVRKFAFETMPVILKRQESQYRNTVSLPISIVRQALGEQIEMRYIIERMEQWPQHLQVTSNSSWPALGSALNDCRVRGGLDRGEGIALEHRALKLVIAELKQYLDSQESNNQSIFHHDHTGYWTAKADDFARATEEVYQARKGSGRRVQFIANYFWSGLSRRNRAIEILFIALDDAILDVNGRQVLVNYLQGDSRYGESIPLLAGLVKEMPDNLYLRTQLMRAYHYTKRAEQLADTIKQIDKYFHQGGRWTEGNIGQFADACRQCELNELAIGYFNEAISAHQRTYPGSGLGDGTLSNWYQQLAYAHSSLHHTKEAVDAASASIVCWGPRYSQRTQAIQHLRGVLQSARDLDAYVKTLDEETDKTGKDAPLLRKTIGQVYQERRQFDKALVQLNLARQLQPNDKETCQALIVCYDANKQQAEGTKELLALFDFDRHDLKLYEQLAERLKDNEPEAERAATSIIEAGPTESENHTAMAELRQRQNRWDEAIGEWKDVAELRRLEPTGLLKLAEAQVHQKQWDAARQSLDKLSKTEWPSRFNNDLNKVHELRNQLPK